MKTLFAAACMLCATMALAAPETFLPAGKSLALPDGRTLVAGSVRTETGYNVAVKRLVPDGSADPSFGPDGNGIVQIPFWGYYENAHWLTLQRDGRILVAGNAADPILRDPYSCYPAFCMTYPVIARLMPDGSLDTSFNGTGKITLAIGNANEGVGDVPDSGVLYGIDVDVDGRISVEALDGRIVAGVLPDGTLDRSFRNSEVNLVAREVMFERHQGLWYTITEGGYRLALAQQGNTLFGIWFMAQEGGPHSWGSWLVWIATKVGPNAYDGRLYDARGPLGRVTSRDVGSATFAVDGSGEGQFSYVVGSAMGSLAGKKYLKLYDAGRTCTWGAQTNLSLATNYDGHWWAAPAGSESGWGLHLTHKADGLELAWMTYDEAGAPVWYSSAMGRKPDGTYAGQLLHQTGDETPYMAVGDFDIVGTAALSFTDGNAGTFRYTVYGNSQEKAITRFVFDGPGTICSR